MSEEMLFVTAIDSSSTLWVNTALIEATGYSFEDYRFGNFENPFIPQEDLKRVAAFLQDFLESGEPVSGIVRNRFVDRWGGTLHVRSRIARVDWEGEPALLYTTVAEDQEGTQPLEAEERYRSLVEIASDSILQLFSDLRFRYSNKCFQDLVGRSPLELASSRFPDLIAENEQALCDEVLTSLEGTVTDTWRIVDSGGRSRWLEGTFVRIQRGPDAGLIQAILRDVTEKRALERRIRQAQKRETVAQLAAGVAHDLNNILTGILGSVTVARRSPNPETSSEALADINLAAERAGQPSSALLVYAGEGATTRHPVEWYSLIAEMRPLLSSALPKDIRLTVEVADGQVFVHAAATELRQVVMNLITNGADAMAGSPGEVRVEAGTAAAGPKNVVDGTWVGTVPETSPVAFVRVLDRGSGIPSEVLQKMFDPFYSTKGSGRGLGLSTVIGVVEQHGGCIAVERRPGGGTQFEVWLPTISDPDPSR